MLQLRDWCSVSYCWTANQTGIYFSELPQWLRNRRYRSGLGLPIVEIGPVVLEKKMKLWKVYDKANDDANYNEGQRTILLRKAHLSLRLRWALTSFLYFFNHFSSFITTWCRVLGSGSVTTCFYDFGIRTSGLPSTRRTLIKIWLIGPPPRPKGRNKVQTYRKMTIHGWDEKIAEPK